MLKENDVSVQAAYPKKLSKKQAAVERFKRDLGEELACFVLITCAPPSADGNMEVELEYGGDEILASFLVDNAAEAFDNQESFSKTK